MPHIIARLFIVVGNMLAMAYVPAFFSVRALEAGIIMTVGTAIA